MPILATTAKLEEPGSTAPPAMYPVKYGKTSSNGVYAYSAIGYSHANPPPSKPAGPNEDAFVIAIVDEGMISDAKAAKEMLRQLRDTGADAVSTLTQEQEEFREAGTTLAAAATYGDWTQTGNPESRGFAIACSGDSGIAWRDRKTGKVVQLSIAQETAQIIGRQHPITNWLGQSLIGNKSGQTQDSEDQIIAFSETDLRARGIDPANGGALIVFSDGIVQMASQSSAYGDQLVYDQETQQLQAMEIEELYNPDAPNKALGLGIAAEQKGSMDDRTVIIFELPPPGKKGSKGQRVAYVCDGVGGEAGGWHASNAAVTAAGAYIERLEHAYALERRGGHRTYNIFARLTRWLLPLSGHGTSKARK